MSRAATLVTSPSAVKSLKPPPPTLPTNSSPLAIPTPTPSQSTIRCVAERAVVRNQEILVLGNPAHRVCRGSFPRLIDVHGESDEARVPLVRQFVGEVVPLLFGCEFAFNDDSRP